LCRIRRLICSCCQQSYDESFALLVSLPFVAATGQGFSEPRKQDLLSESSPSHLVDFPAADSSLAPLSRLPPSTPLKPFDWKDLLAENSPLYALETMSPTASVLAAHTPTMRATCAAQAARLPVPSSPSATPLVAPCALALTSAPLFAAPAPL